MNRQSVIRKFTEKCGTPITGKNSLFIYGSAYGKEHIGLTTKFQETVDALIKKYKQDHLGQYPLGFSETTAGHILPKIHQEVDGWMYDFDTGDLLDCMRMLENKPFQKIHVYRWTNEPMPMLFNRSDCDISVVLAPIMLPIPKDDGKDHTPIKKIHKEIMTTWIRQLDPRTSFWLVSIDYMNDRPPIQTVKCTKCNCEIDKLTYINVYLKRNHLECTCTCDTYEDFCGCRRNRELNQIEKIRRETQVVRHFMSKKWS